MAHQPRLGCWGLLSVVLWACCLLTLPSHTRPARQTKTDALPGSAVVGSAALSRVVPLAPDATGSRRRWAIVIGNGERPGLSCCKPDASATEVTAAVGGVLWRAGFGPCAGRQRAGRGAGIRCHATVYTRFSARPCLPVDGALARFRAFRAEHDTACIERAEGGNENCYLHSILR